jgi:hypothetical protein
MFRTLTALAGAASLALAVIATGLGADRQMAAEISHAVVGGVILGSGVWPYNLVLGSTELRPQLVLGSADCEGQLRCRRDRID